MERLTINDIEREFRNAQIRSPRLSTKEWNERIDDNFEKRERLERDLKSAGERKKNDMGNLLGLPD